MFLQNCLIYKYSTKAKWEQTRFANSHFALVPIHISPSIFLPSFTCIYQLRQNENTSWNIKTFLIETVETSVVKFVNDLLFKLLFVAHSSNFTMN
jgi:hypothetical protein